MAETSRRSDSTEHDDEPRTLEGNAPADRKWWWSPVLMIVVGVAVVAYQYSAITGEGAIVLNWVLVAIGGTVAIAGLVSLKRAWDAERTG